MTSFRHNQRRVWLIPASIAMWALFASVGSVYSDPSSANLLRTTIANELKKDFDPNTGNSHFPEFEAFKPTWSETPSDTQLVRAFEEDGYHISSWIQFEGARGVEGESNNVTLRSTGEYKKVYYVEGSAYQMGYLFGSMTEPAATEMVTTYYSKSVEGFFASSLREKFGNDTLYAEAMVIIVDFVTAEAVLKWEIEIADGIIPNNFAEEARGIADGSKSANPKTKVTYSMVAAMATVYDYMLSHVYAGVWVGMVKAELPKRYTLSESLFNALMKLTDDDMVVFDHCNAFAVRKQATKSGRGAYFGRDFQFDNQDVWQKTNTMVIYNPSDGRIPFVAVTAPSMVGIISGMNAEGVGIGLNMLRSAAANPQRPGFSGALLIRHVMHHATSSSDALHLISEARRGTPYLYPISDAQGQGLVVEGGKFTEVHEDPLKYAQDYLIPYLPEPLVLDLVSPWWQVHNGAYSRWITYQYPELLLEYNQALLEMRNVSAHAGMWGERGFVASNYTDDEHLAQILMNNYFTPQREENDDIVLVSNFALMPAMRISQMSLEPDKLTLHAESIQWRYDELNLRLLDAFGTIDFEEAKNILSYLSPDVTPGYWKGVPIDPTDPMTIQIQGALSMMDLREGFLHTKSGYWCDGWLQLTIGKYVNDEALTS